MKTITVKQPWASLIVEGIKDIENRTWKTKFRGRVLIHSSAKPVCKPTEIFSLFNREQFLSLPEHTEGSPATIAVLSSIIGSVEIVDCVINHESIWAEKSEPELWDEDGKPVYDRPIYNWVLANPIKIDHPIEDIKGKLSFWEYDGINAVQEEDDGLLWCHCHWPQLTSNSGGRGVALCTLCQSPFYH